MISIAFICALVISYASFPLVIPRLVRSHITGKDLNKPGQPKIANIGGIVTVGGFSAGILIIIALKTFTNQFDYLDLQYLLAALSTVLTAVLVGIVDDFVSLRQWFKALTPIVCALPLVAVKAGETSVFIPFQGQVDIGIVYTLVLVPIGVTIATNAVNMLAGFNGLELGMGFIGMTALAVIAARLNENTSLVILLAGMGALLATLRYNWYPAKVFIGDAGTLSIGAMMAAAVIIGNFEWAGVIIMIPYAADFFIKAANRFPSLGWEGVYRNGKLYCPNARPKGLAQFVLKLTGGLHERSLTLILIVVEAIFGGLAIWLIH